MVLMIDNFDSFTYNLVHYLEILGAEVLVRRNNAITLDEAIKLNPSHLIVSPGPGYPKTAGSSSELIRHFSPSKPVLGVCLGHQCIGEIHGRKIVRSQKILHGKTSPIHHLQQGLFAGLQNSFQATRYHSLIIERKAHERFAKTSDDPAQKKRDHEPQKNAPTHLAAHSPTDDPLIITAWSDHDEIMGIAHRLLPLLHGVQFHPESIASEEGLPLLRNFLALAPLV